MRVLVVHNFYSSRFPSGENLSVSDEVAWLRDAGVDVRTHEASNDEMTGIARAATFHQAVELPWSRAAARRLRADVEAFEPDVVHVHNLFPLLSGSVPWAAIRAGIPVVWTCRNRRIVCVEGTHFRNGGPCTDCRPGWRVPGIRHGCYQRLAVERGEVGRVGSIAASGLVTVASSAFGAIARRRVLAIGIAENVREWLIASAGFDPARVRVKFNGVAAPGNRSVPPPEQGDVFLFAGQLADYKGVPLLLEAWKRARPAGARLRVVGGGSCASAVEDAARDDASITAVGVVTRQTMAEELARSRVVVAPSTTAETFGRVAAEALAYGRPVITTGLGGLGEIVDGTSGWVTGVDADQLASAISEAATSDAAVAARGRNGRRRHAERFSPEATTAALLDIYREAIDSAGQTSRSPR